MTVLKSTHEAESAVKKEQRINNSDRFANAQLLQLNLSAGTALGEEIPDLCTVHLGVAQPARSQRATGVPL